MKTSNLNIDFEYNTTQRLVLEKAITATIDASLTQVASVGYDTTTNLLKYRDNVGIKNVASQEWTTANFAIGSFVKTDGTAPLTGNWSAGNFRISVQTIGVNTGNTTPSTNFHIVSTSTSTVRGILNDQYSASTDSAKIYNRKARGTFALPTTVITGDVLGNWTSSGYDGTSFVDSADMRVLSTGTISTGIVPAQIMFRTMDTSGTLTTAITINESQFLGVGTSSPLVNFHVVAQSSADPRGVLIDNYGASGRLRVRRANGTIASPTTVITTDTNGMISSEMYDGTAFRQVTSIYAMARGTISTGVIPADIVFNTTNTSGSMLAFMMLSREGRLLLNSTDASVTTPSASFTVTRNESASAWTTSGIGLRWDAATYTDTSSSGTVATMYVHSFATPTVAASSSTTYTSAYALAINPVAAGTNVTITTAYALLVNGLSTFANTVSITGNLNFSGAVRTIQTTDSSNLQIGTNSTIRAIISAATGAFVIGTAFPTIAPVFAINVSSRTNNAWTTAGIGFTQAAATYTDQTSSGTVAAQYVNVFGAPTLVASSATTYTLSSTMFIGSPVASTNVTQTNQASLVLADNLFFQKGASTRFGTFDVQTLSIFTGNVSRIAITGTGLQTNTQDILSSGTTAFITFTQAAHTGGAQPGMLWTAGALTAQTASAEVTDINYDLSATKTWAAGTITLQRDFRIQGRTYAFASASTITTAATLAVTAPVAGTNATITNNFAIRSAGSICLAIAGNKLFIKEGTDGSVGQTTLVAGVKAITIAGLTTSSRAFPGFVAQGGTVTTTWQYKFVCTANTLTITAIDNTGATNTLDTSTLNYFIIEPAP